MMIEKGLSTRLKKIFIFILVFCIVFSYVYNQNLATNSRYIEASTSDLGTVEGWDFNTSRDASQYVLSDNATILKPKTFCDGSTFLLIIVCSAPINTQHRNSIRESWGSQRNISEKNVAVYFLMGDSNDESIQSDILKENDMYEDIIQDHFVDSYNNLTLKSIVMLKLVTMYCSPQNVTYLMKTDDDMFVNVPPLIDTLMKLNTTNVLIGSLICGAKHIAFLRVCFTSFNIIQNSYDNSFKYYFLTPDDGLQLCLTAY